MTLVFQAIWLVRYLWLKDIVHLPGGGQWNNGGCWRKPPAFCRSDRERHPANVKYFNILNDTKKATKLGMKVFRDRQCFNTQFAHKSSVFCPERQPPLMSLFSLLEQQLSFQGSISKSHPSQLDFHWVAKRRHSRKFDCRYLSKKWLWFATLQQQAHGMISRGNITNCSSNFCFK